MAKHKKSFFERLTGTVKISDDEAEIETEEEEVEKEAEETKDRNIGDDDSDGQLAVDVYQTNSDIVIKTMVAGIRPEDLDISITRDMVTIKGSREDSAAIEDENFFQRELFCGSFSRTILLPQEVEIEEAEAIERHGLLTIKLPKINKDRQTKLRVKAS